MKPEVRAALRASQYKIDAAVSKRGQEVARRYLAKHPRPRVNHAHETLGGVVFALTVIAVLVIVLAL